ncbi:MAG: hypothetical protein SF028_08145 [Candidatus Sumerlaeia bacterium]|nr:hypothetical protein [Candidatus Sumerlaeia bacterium]
MIFNTLRSPVTLATLALACALHTAPAALAQRAQDDSRPGGVELRPAAPPAPAAADMVPSQLFSKPTVTPPVLPTPAAAPVPPPATPAPTTKPAGGPPAASPPAAPPAAVTPPAAPPPKVLPYAPPPATRSLRAAPPAAGSAPAAPMPSGEAPSPSGTMKGNDRLPGGVERVPSRE